MNILILADPYGRPSYAPRLRYLCEYLHQQGHTVEVYTEKWDTLEFEHKYPIHEISFYHLGYISWAIKTLFTLLTDWKDRYFARVVLWKTRKQHFDVVFCTTFSTFPLTAARIVAEKKGLKLLTDIRDLDEQVPGHQYINHRQRMLKPFRDWYSRVNAERRNKVLEVADAITTISPWHVEFIKPINPNVHLIYNGFDPDLFYAENIKADIFQINYIGRMYEFQDPSLLFTAVRELNLPKCQVNFYTNMSAIERIQEKGVHTFGFLPTMAIPDMIRRSSILVVLTNPKTNGMMTTKFFEALGCEKPVLCIPSDNGMLAATIQQTNAGIATSDLAEVKQFILDRYEEWKANGYTRQPVADTSLFNRKNQAQQIEALLQKLC